MDKEKWMYLACFLIGMVVMYYFMQSKTECMVKFTKSSGEIHMLVGVIK